MFECARQHTSLDTIVLAQRKHTQRCKGTRTHGHHQGCCTMTMAYCTHRPTQHRQHLILRVHLVCRTAWARLVPASAWRRGEKAHSKHSQHRTQLGPGDNAHVGWHSNCTCRPGSLRAAHHSTDTEHTHITSKHHTRKRSIKSWAIAAHTHADIDTHESDPCGHCGRESERDGKILPHLRRR